MKLLIVEDEPLVQVGLNSMLDWANLGIEVCAMAKDGVQALEYIEKYSPKIVISDIKMPRMNGLELMKTSRDRFGTLPVFIILTSYEEFKFLKEAMEYDVVDYLIKLDLNEKTLTSSIRKALNIVNTIQLIPSSPSLSPKPSLSPFYDRFFVKLLLDFFKDEDEMKAQGQELGLDFSSTSYVVTYCKIVEYSPMWTSSDNDKLLNLYSNTLQMVREIIKKYVSSYIISLDTKHFSIIFCFDNEEKNDYKNIIGNTLENTFKMIHNYFNVKIITGVGNPCDKAINISESYQDARQALNLTSEDNPVFFYQDLLSDNNPVIVFNLSLFKDDIKKAFEEFDNKALSSIFNQIIELFNLHPTHLLQTIDAACSILFASISMLTEGEKVVTEIFSNDVDNYRAIYKKTSIDQVISWMHLLRDGLCNHLKGQKTQYRNHIVTNAKHYINSHINEKITLTSVSSALGISPNYLSTLFSRHNDICFSDYITHSKIEKSKVLMAKDNYRIYEIADILGFESPFYFSKVFKKVEGISPSEYINKRIV